MKKIFTLFAVMFVALAASAQTTLYLNPSIWYWSGNNEKFAIYSWNDDESEKSWTGYLELAENETNVWTGTIPAGHKKFIFVRFGKGDGNPENWYETVAPDWENGHVWNKTNDLTIQENGDDLYTITAWGENYGPCPGAWSKYVYVEPAKFYITGNAALVGKEHAWKSGEEAIKSTTDEYTFENLPAGNYCFKVITPEAAYLGFDNLTAESKAVELYPDNDRNVNFILETPGDVTITYKKDEVFKVEGAFVSPVVKLNGINETPDVLELAEDKLSASATLHLTASSYELKVIVADSWLGKKHGEEEPKYEINSGWNWVDGLTWDGDDIRFVPTFAGDYTFKWTFATGKLEVTYPLPYVALIGNMNGWDGAVDPFEPAEDRKTASVTVNLKMNADEGYQFKILSGSIGLSINDGDKMYTFHDGHKSANVKYVNAESKPLFIKIAMEGDYTFTWSYADSLLTITYPEYPAVELEDGFYLIGQKGWIVNALSNELKFAKNEGDEKEWVLKSVVLTEGQRIKVVKVESNAITAWYGTGEGYAENYAVTSDIAGTKDVYFSEDDEKKAAWNGFIYIEKNGSTAIDNTAAEVKAVKIVENGQLFIIKNGVKYNATGAVVK